jgi:myosin-5
MKAVASRVTEKSDVLLLTPVDMEDSGPYEIAEPRVITALETYTPSCECFDQMAPRVLTISRAPNTAFETSRRNSLGTGNGPAREA